MSFLFYLRSFRIFFLHYIFESRHFLVFQKITFGDMLNYLFLPVQDKIKNNILYRITYAGIYIHDEAATCMWLCRKAYHSAFYISKDKIGTMLYNWYTFYGVSIHYGCSIKWWKAFLVCV